MILLNGQTLGIRDRFPVDSMALNLEERNSNATITIGPDAPAIAVGNWLKDETEPGAGIVWRVKTVTEQVETRTRTIQLEHAIQTLKDCLIFGEAKPETMGGTGGKCTARQAITWALKQQSAWRLGDLAENPSNPYSFNGDSVYSIIETVTSSLNGCQWEYDLRTMPFTLHIRKEPAGFSSEMRMSRNITSLRKQIDRSRMYTRHYPIGKNNLHIDGGYLSKNEGIWGRVDKVETDQSLDTAEKLRAWSQERLNRHCDPLVTVTVSGLEMSRDTGEPLDHIVIGRKCRMPLPEYGTTITEKVTKISWADKVREPEKITVTMANLMEDVASIVNSMAAASGRSSRAGAKKNEEDHAWVVDTDTHVGLVAEAVAGEGADKDWSRVAQVMVDGQGIHQRVTKAEDDIVRAWSEIEVAENAIKIEVNERKNEDNRLNTTLTGRINVQAGKIALVVTEKDGENVIKAAEIVTAINAEGSSVGISADHVFITGRTRLSGQLTVQDGSLMVKTALIVSGSSGGNVTVNNGSVNAKTHQVNSGGMLRFVGGGTGEHYDVTTDVLKGMIKSAEVNGNILTLTPFWGDPINFSKAVPQVRLTGGWNGRTFTVTEASSGNTYSEAPQYETGAGYGQNDSITVSEFSSQHMAFARVKASAAQGGNILWGFKVDASGQYSDGQTNGRNGVNILKGAWNSGRIEFAKSAGTASTKAVRIGATTGWQSGVFTATVRDYENNPSGDETGYTIQTDLGTPSMAKPSIQPGSASTSGRRQAGTGNLSKSAIIVNGYLFFDLTVRGQVLKFYCPVGA